MLSMLFNHFCVCFQCLEKIHGLIDDEEELNKTSFLETAQRTLHFLINYNCTVALGNLFQKVNVKH